MTLQRKAMLAILTLVGVSALGVTPARAEIAVTFDMNSSGLDYMFFGSNLTVRGTSGSVFDARRENTAVRTILEEDQAHIGGLFDLNLNLTMMAPSGASIWSPTGSLEGDPDFAGVLGAAGLSSGGDAYAVSGTPAVPGPSPSQVNPTVYPHEGGEPGSSPPDPSRVPAPGAVLLGALGLGLVGWVRMRYAKAARP